MKSDLVFVREVRINYHGPKRKALTGIREPVHAAEFVRKLLPDNSREHFVGLYLNGAHEIIAFSIIATGIANSCPVHAREVYQAAILSGAVSVLVAHNHPSGQCIPSAEDKALTKKLKEAGELLNIRLLDHVIVTESSHYSIMTEESL
jgi:DNA repair protein RadC